MARYENILETIGDTPLVRLNRLVRPHLMQIDPYELLPGWVQPRKYA